jgi:hypothetical protein
MDLAISFFKQKRDYPSDKDVRLQSLSTMIYPTLLSCVRNRYLILLGYFIYFSFILNSWNIALNLYVNRSGFNFAISLLFLYISAYNLVNYAVNYRDERILDGRDKETNLKDFWGNFSSLIAFTVQSPMEWFFSFVMIIMVSITTLIMI